MKMSKGLMLALVAVVIVGAVWFVTSGGSDSDSNAGSTENSAPADSGNMNLSMADADPSMPTPPADPTMNGDSSMQTPTPSGATDLNGAMTVPPSTPDSMQPPTGMDSGMTPPAPDSMPAPTDAMQPSADTSPAPAGSQSTRLHKPGRAPRNVTTTPAPATPAAPVVDSTTLSQ